MAERKFIVIYRDSEQLVWVYTEEEVQRYLLDNDAGGWAGWTITKSFEEYQQTKSVPGSGVLLILNYSLGVVPTVKTTEWEFPDA